MPLRKGGKSAVSANMRELTKANKHRKRKRSRKQMAAIAYAGARRRK